MSKVFLCQINELEAGEMKKVSAPDGASICVYNIDGNFYATDDVCTHATASLAEGDLEDDLVTCPVHWGQFHVPSGKAVTLPCERNLQTYRVSIDGNDVFADTNTPSKEAETIAASLI